MLLAVQRKPEVVVATGASWQAKNQSYALRLKSGGGGKYKQHQYEMDRFEELLQEYDAKIVPVLTKIVAEMRAALDTMAKEDGIEDESFCIDICQADISKLVELHGKILDRRCSEQREKANNIARKNQTDRSKYDKEHPYSY